MAAYKLVLFNFKLRLKHLLLHIPYIFSYLFFKEVLLLLHFLLVTFQVLQTKFFNSLFLFKPIHSSAFCLDFINLGLKFNLMITFLCLKLIFQSLVFYLSCLKLLTKLFLYLFNPSSISLSLSLIFLNFRFTFNNQSLYFRKLQFYHLLFFKAIILIVLHILSFKLF